MWTGRVPRRVTRVDAPAAPAMAAKPIGRKCSPASRAESPRTCCRKIAVRKNMARNAAPFRARPRLAVCRPRVRNRRSGTSGAAERDSTTKKAAKRATAPASSATTSVAPQPSGSARMTPSTSVRSPPVPSAAPVTFSPRGPSMPARLSRTNSGVVAIRAMPIGTLTKKTPCQPIASTSTPPATTPSVPPRPARPPQMPMARLRSRPWANVTVRIESAAGGEQRAAQALGRTRGDEDAWPRREPGHERGAREERHAGHEHPAAAEQVTGAAAEQQEAAEQQRVGADDPLQPRGGEAEVRLDVGKRDVHDRHVEDDHELGQGEDREGGPTAASHCTAPQNDLDVERFGGRRYHGQMNRSSIE